jgi:N-acetylneuraminate synthase/N,N'-diacetyllegionaminate synthase
MTLNTVSAPITVGSRKIGDGHPIYIMADVGLTNGGDIKRTFQLIDIAADLGVDAIKFQMIGPETLLGDKTAEYTYPTLNDGPIKENMYEMFCGLTYSEEEWHKIANYVRSKNIEFICTAHYMGAVPMLERIGVNIHKICTWSMTHKRLVQSIGKTGKPMMLDTGAFTTQSLSQTLDWHSEAGGRGALILHDFHTDVSAEMNFRAIPFMKNMFGCPVGYTPQGRDYDMDFLSVGMGVNILEKRLTVDRGIPKNGHIKALEPNEFSDWLKRIRSAESTLGVSNVLPTKADIEQSGKYFKSLYLNVDLKEGDVIVDDMLEARRPGHGISAKDVDLVIGRRMAKAKKAEEMLSWLDFK